MRTANLLTAAIAPAAMASAQHQAAVQQHSAWHSPVPYLFGGLAAMLGLIAFALLILACSYWKLSGYLEGGSDGSGGRGDIEGGNSKPGDAGEAKAPPHSLEQGFVVIMAGEEKPTFLATPMSSRASSFGDNKKGEGGEEENEKDDEKKPPAVEAGDSEATTRDAHRQLQEAAHESQEETHHDQDRRQIPEATHQSVDRNQ